MTPLELAAGYLPFINQGVGKQPMCVREINDSDYNTIRSFRPAEKVLLQPATAFQMASTLRAVVLHGTGRPIRRHFDQRREEEPKRLIPDMGGKTGTTNDCTDAWFAGFTPELVVVVYMGFDAPRSMGPQMTGSYVTGDTWCRIVDRILRQQKTWQRSFAEPPGTEYANIDTEPGTIIEPGDPVSGELRRVPFKRGTLSLLAARRR
jgi:penicillin-binding protein 1A